MKNLLLPVLLIALLPLCAPLAAPPLNILNRADKDLVPVVLEKLNAEYGGARQPKAPPGE